MAGSDLLSRSTCTTLCISEPECGTVFAAPLVLILDLELSMHPVMWLTLTQCNDFTELSTVPVLIVQVTPARAQHKSIRARVGTTVSVASPL